MAGKKLAALAPSTNTMIRRSLSSPKVWEYSEEYVFVYPLYLLLLGFCSLSPIIINFSTFTHEKKVQFQIWYG
jgi:hypothetical protein